VVAGGMCCNRTDVAFYRKRQNSVEGPSIFERAAVLKVFALEHDFSVYPFVEGWGVHHGRTDEARADAVCGRRYVCEGGDFGGVGLHVR